MRSLRQKRGVGVVLRDEIRLFVNDLLRKYSKIKTDQIAPRDVGRLQECCPDLNSSWTLEYFIWTVSLIFVIKRFVRGLIRLYVSPNSWWSYPRRLPHSPSTKIRHSSFFPQTYYCRAHFNFSTQTDHQFSSRTHRVLYWLVGLFLLVKQIDRSLCVLEISPNDEPRRVYSRLPFHSKVSLFLVSTHERCLHRGLWSNRKDSTMVPSTALLVLWTDLCFDWSL